MLDILGIVAFAVVFGFWWAFKPHWSRAGAGGRHASDRAASTPPAHAAATERATPAQQGKGDPQPHGFRPDIEGLRAIAVLLVLGFHIGEVRYTAQRTGGDRPWFFDGGFIGVDVFFVLSGFLITSLLLRELTTTGTISLSNFWSRRARRLLAASCLTVVVTLVLSRSMLPPLRQDQLAHDAIAASLFVTNIVFARRDNDYLASQLAPSPLLHFWSLSLEEQFYLVWPGLLLVVARGKAVLQRAAVLIGVLAVASFAACLWFTNNKPVWAFYLLPTRAWELLIGAGLAVAGTRVLRISPQARALLAWAGIGTIVVAAIAFSTASTFPGAIALLPVLGTAAVIAAGGRVGPGRLLSTPPLQWIGKRSYAIYLWHWPALILFDAKFGPLDVWQLVAIVAGSVVVSAISYRLVEDPVRRSKGLATPPQRGLALGGALVLLGIGVSVFVLRNPQSLSGGGTASEPTLAVPTTALVETVPGVSDPGTTAVPPVGDLDTLESAAAPVLEEAAATEVVPDNLRPSLREVRGDLPGIYDDGCLLPESGSITSGECVYGDPSSTTTVVLAGDSHAAQWFPAVELAAQRRGWRLVVLAKRGCPAADFTTYGANNRERTGCDPWRDSVGERLAQEQPDLLIVTSYRYRLTSDNAPADSAEVWQAALTDTLGAWRPMAKQMLVLSDTPNPTDDVPTCLSANLRDVTDCVRPRDEADKADLLAAEQAATRAADGTLAVSSDWLCGPQTCPVILGDLLMYRDDNHITATMAEYLTPFVEAAATPLLSG